MSLIDTSAWVEFLRGTGSPQALQVRKLIQAGDVVVVDVVRLELLAGAGSAERAGDLLRLIAGFRFEQTRSPQDHDDAAALYRRARSAGETVRSLLDCLIAAVAIRLDLPVLARDRDFEVLSQVSALRLT